MRLARNPDLLLAWRDGRLLVVDLRHGRRFGAGPNLMPLLDAFSEPGTEEEGAARLPGYRRHSVLRSIRQLVRNGLLVTAAYGTRQQARLDIWKHNLASAFYHSAVRDMRYLKDPGAIELQMRSRFAAHGPPLGFKRYPSRPRVELPATTPDGDTAALHRVLAARRTVRAFARRPVLLDDLAAIVRGTWGQTGWLELGGFGRAPTRSSPSGGALHPIEVYLIAWRVKDLRPGLYHYDVTGDVLRRLRSGDLRAEAVAAASGQRWVGQAAFLCIMTAVFERTLWKYQLENAYRTLWLEAGHLAQSFSLLATARGLGPYTTAAMQDSRIEKLLGLDGVKEFPVYLCGAGVPHAKRRRPPWRPLREVRSQTR